MKSTEELLCCVNNTGSDKEDSGVNFDHETEANFEDGFTFSTLQLNLKELKHILWVLERNQELRNQQRDKLSKVSDRVHRKKQKVNETCPVCDNTVEGDDFINCVRCKGCDHLICRKPKCSDWIPNRGESEWECKLCSQNRKSQHKAGEWLLQQLNQRFHLPVDRQISLKRQISDVTKNDGKSQENLYDDPIPLDQKEKVRQFLEDLLASMLGGPLDNVPVGPLEKSNQYLELFTKFHKSLSEILFSLENSIHRSLSDLPLWDHECPGVSHVNLKRLIEKIVIEAAKVPNIFNQSGIPDRPEAHLPYFDPKRYHELVATACLNKICESYHNRDNEIKPFESSSGIQSGGSDLDSNHNAVNKQKKDDLNQTSGTNSNDQPASMTIDEQYSPIESPESSSNFVYSSNVSDNEGYLENYIQTHKDRIPLPDLSADSETNDDDIQSSQSNGTDGTWEDNWLFKSRKFKSETTNSIAMLVPQPTEDVKALIGEDPADEVSDLSDAEVDENNADGDEESSSDDDEENMNSADIPNVITQNKTIIGGKHSLFDMAEPVHKNGGEHSPRYSTIEARNEIVENGFVKLEKPIFDTLNREKIIKMEEAINPFVTNNNNEGEDETTKVVIENMGDGETDLKLELEVDDDFKIVRKETEELRPVPAPRKTSKPESSADHPPQPAPHTNTNHNNQNTNPIITATNINEIVEHNDVDPVDNNKNDENEQKMATSTTSSDDWVLVEEKPVSDIADKSEIVNENVSEPGFIYTKPKPFFVDQIETDPVDETKPKIENVKIIAEVLHEEIVTKPLLQKTTESNEPQHLIVENNNAQDTLPSVDVVDATVFHLKIHDSPLDILQSDIQNVNDEPKKLFHRQIEEVDSKRDIQPVIEMEKSAVLNEQIHLISDSDPVVAQESTVVEPQKPCEVVTDNDVQKMSVEESTSETPICKIQNTNNPILNEEPKQLCTRTVEEINEKPNPETMVIKVTVEMLHEEFEEIPKNIEKSTVMNEQIHLISEIDPVAAQESSVVEPQKLCEAVTNEIPQSVTKPVNEPAPTRCQLKVVHEIIKPQVDEPEVPTIRLEMEKIGCEMEVVETPVCKNQDTSINEIHFVHQEPKQLCTRTVEEFTENPKPETIVTKVIVEMLHEEFEEIPTVTEKPSVKNEQIHLIGDTNEKYEIKPEDTPVVCAKVLAEMLHQEIEPITTITEKPTVFNEQIHLIEVKPLESYVSETDKPIEVVIDEISVGFVYQQPKPFFLRYEDQSTTNPGKEIVPESCKTKVLEEVLHEEITPEVVIQNRPNELKQDPQMVYEMEVIETPTCKNQEEPASYSEELNKSESGVFYQQAKPFFVQQYDIVDNTLIEEPQSNTPSNNETPVQNVIKTFEVVLHEEIVPENVTKQADVDLKEKKQLTCEFEVVETPTIADQLIEKDHEVEIKETDPNVQQNVVKTYQEVLHMEIQPVSLTKSQSNDEPVVSCQQAKPIFLQEYETIQSEDPIVTESPINDEKNIELHSEIKIVIEPATPIPVGELVSTIENDQENSQTDITEKSKIGKIQIPSIFEQGESSINATASHTHKNLHEIIETTPRVETHIVTPISDIPHTLEYTTSVVDHKTENTEPKSLTPITEEKSILLKINQISDIVDPVETQHVQPDTIPSQVEGEDVTLITNDDKTPTLIKMKVTQEIVYEHFPKEDPVSTEHFDNIQIVAEKESKTNEKKKDLQTLLHEIIDEQPQETFSFEEVKPVDLIPSNSTGLQPKPRHIETKSEIVLNENPQMAIESHSLDLNPFKVVRDRGGFQGQPEPTPKSPVRQPNNFDILRGLSEDSKNVTTWTPEKNQSDDWEPQTVEIDQDVNFLPKLDLSDATLESSTSHRRYQSPLFACLLPKTPPPTVVKISNMLSFEKEDDENVMTVDNPNLKEDIENVDVIVENTNPEPTFINTINIVTNEIEPTNVENITNIVTNQVEPKKVENSINTENSIITEKVQETNEPSPSLEQKVEDVHENEPEFMVKGSIAEREHLKWQNAAPIANNPYSPEALQRRLSEVHSKPGIDLGHAAQATETPKEKETAKTEKLVDVFKAEEKQQIYKRFGRDYYINEAKKASGERLRRSQLESRLAQQTFEDQEFPEDQISSTNSVQEPSNTDSETDSPVKSDEIERQNNLQRSKSSGDVDKNLENIFAARPILVEEDNPILLKAKKIESLSSDDRDFYLLPIEDAHSLSLASSEHSLGSPSESPSEDSDSIRIYNLNTLETKIVKDKPVNSKSKTLPPALTPKVTGTIPKLPLVTAPIVPKTLSPTTVKYLSKIKKPPVNMTTTQIHIDIKPTNGQNDDIHRHVAHVADSTVSAPTTNGNAKVNSVIEEDVQIALPSVRQLAKSFIKTENKEPVGPIVRPKTLEWKNETSETPQVIINNDKEQPPREPSPDSYAPPYNQSYQPMAPSHSISGRSLSKQFKDELKLVGIDDNTENVQHVSPPRTPSPDLQKGKLKNNIAFFENLNKK